MNHITTGEPAVIAHGDHECPDAGHLFNPAKLLLDPYARAIDGAVRWHESLRIAQRGSAHSPLHPDPADSAAHLPRSVVVADDFDWRGDRPPGVPWSESVIYECHVKGMTALHPGVPAPTAWYLARPRRRTGHRAPQEPGRHGGGAAASAARGRQRAARAQRPHELLGYATIGFFAPDRRFASVAGRERHEFREMVRLLHAAGIEVLLDVVYNHTGEGGVDGPTVAFRGLDNAAYYRLRMTAGGCTRTSPAAATRSTCATRVVRRLILDSLRFWVTEMHVDGFRFDLAPVLGRDPTAFDAGAPFFREIAADPVLRGTKLIAEPWDLGPAGYQQGGFPPPFAEWNGRFRDTVRRFWRGVGGVNDVATRLSGSSDLFPPPRAPQSSVNFIACHDGFTLQDLVSYERKHNLANGERNRDGADWNESRNWGIEGPTADAQVLELRARAMRSMMATLVLSLGVPMLNQGDELGRTQQGNNNPWNQDSAPPAGCRGSPRPHPS